MKQAKFHVAYLSINHFNPVLCDGVSVSSLELLQYLMDHGHEAIVLHYCTNETNKLSNANWIGTNDNRRLNDNKLRPYSYAINDILVYEELLPFNQSELMKNYDYLLRSMTNIIKETKTDYLITVEDDSLALLPGMILDIPGAHFFHSPIYLSSYQDSPFFKKILKKRNLFTVSHFLQEKIKKELNLDSNLWYPLFDLEKYRLRKKCKKNNHAGYYSAGPHKGDEIVNQLVLELPEYNFIVIGRNYSHSFDQIPKNLMIWNDNSDCSRFYNSVGLLLVPSMIEEGFPRVILEAATNGIPAVANSLGGIPEALGDSGILVKLDTGDAENLDIHKLTTIYRETIKQIGSDREFSRELQKKAIIRAQTYKTKQAQLSKKNLRKMFHG
ncbi:MAG: glycosyltransferase [Desulfobacterales bacterium]|nr:glycosyltransferase [Desulfobacterales bacterium]